MKFIEIVRSNSSFIRSKHKLNILSLEVIEPRDSYQKPTDIITEYSVT